MEVKKQNKAYSSFSYNYFVKEEKQIAVMDYKLNVFADCQNDCVKMSVDTINMKIIKQQQQKNKTI